MKRLIVIAGPTGVGKTSYAIKKALELKAEIFNADSRQVYQEMSIGTAKPTQTERKVIKHHLIDHVSVHEDYTAGDYESDAMSAIEHYFQHHEIAILCGGTGLYLDEVLYGLDSFPEIDTDVRAQVLQDLEDKGLDHLLIELETKDPTYFNIVDKANSRRITRAIEVIRQSNRPFSYFRTGKAKERPFTVEAYVLTRDRSQLYNRINERVDAMINLGLLEEVKKLYAYKHLKALQTVGYQELFAYLDQKLALDEAIALIKRNSRRYAKRQMTWFRKKGWEEITLD